MFKQGDIQVKIGVLVVDYPKFIVVQVDYLPMLLSKHKQLQKEAIHRASEVLEEIGCFALAIDQKQYQSKKLRLKKSLEDKLPFNLEETLRLDCEGIKEMAL